MGLSIHFTTSCVDCLLVNFRQSAQSCRHWSTGKSSSWRCLMAFLVSWWGLRFFSLALKLHLFRVENHPPFWRVLFIYRDGSLKVTLPFNPEIMGPSLTLRASQLIVLRPMCLVFKLQSFQSHWTTSVCVLACTITRLSDWVTAVLAVSRWAVFVTTDISQVSSFYFGTELVLCYLRKKGYRLEAVSGISRTCMVNVRALLLKTRSSISNVQSMKIQINFR
jgi:hypothetical protein